MLGAGIMGSSTALFLARRGVRVTLFDAASAAFAGASRSNEGKIHMGYLYAADPSLDTARRLLPGGLAFKDLTEELIGSAIDPAISPDDDAYAIHRGSVVGVDETARYYDAVSALVRSHADACRYLVPAARPHPIPLTKGELDAGYDTGLIVAGFRVPERSVSTEWIAGRFVAALAAEPRIEQRLQTRVRGVRGGDGTLEGPLFVDTDAGVDGPFDAVVNALWEGRLEIDAGLGLPLPATWSYRFRLSAFIRTTRPVHVPSTVVATGPFGDVKNYTGRDLYLSWYSSGLLAEGGGITAPEVPAVAEGEGARLVGEISRGSAAWSCRCANCRRWSSRRVSPVAGSTRPAVARSTTAPRLCIAAIAWVSTAPARTSRSTRGGTRSHPGWHGRWPSSWRDGPRSAPSTDLGSSPGAHMGIGSFC